MAETLATGGAAAAEGYAARVRSGLMNAPLWVTSVRIVAIPPLMVLLLVDEHPRRALVGASRVFVLACLTDSLDGWLARSRGMVTVAGAFLDPLADKLLISAVLVSPGGDRRRGGVGRDGHHRPRVRRHRACASWPRPRT